MGVRSFGRPLDAFPYRATNDGSARQEDAADESSPGGPTRPPPPRTPCKLKSGGGHGSLAIDNLGDGRLEYSYFIYKYYVYETEGGVKQGVKIMEAKTSRPPSSLMKHRPADTLTLIGRKVTNRL